MERGWGNGRSRRVGGYLVGFTVGWNISDLGAIATRLSHAYGVGLATIGLFTTAQFVVHMVMQIPGGRTADRFGARRTAFLGILVIAAGNAISLPAAHAGARVRRPGRDRPRDGPRVRRGQRLHPRERRLGVDAGRVRLRVGARAGIALALVPGFAGWTGFRAPYLSAIIVAGIALAVLASPPPRRGRLRHAGEHFDAGFFRDTRLYRFAAIHAFSFGFSVVVGDWVVTLFEHHGRSKAFAAAIGSLTLLLGFFTRIVGGLMLRRAGASRCRRREPRARRRRRGRCSVSRCRWALLVTGAAVVGLASGIPFAMAFAGAAHARPDAPGAAVGFVNAWSSLVIVVGAPLVGLTFSLPGDGRIGFIAVGAARRARGARDSAIIVLPTEGSMISFGVTVLPDPPWTRWLELIQLAEQHGFEYAWTYDSHVLWQESIPTLAVAARETSKIKLGHFVTNPATRDPTVLASSYATLHDLSDGRMAMGVGRGDSARALHRPPADEGGGVRAGAHDDQGLHERPRGALERQGPAAQVGARGAAARSRCGSPATGRRRSAVAGRVGDGVIIQLADPEIISWIMDTARRAAEEAGRDPVAAQVHRRRAEPRHGRPRRRARAGALVPGDGVEPRHGSHRAVRHRRQHGAEGAHRLRAGAEVLRLQRPLARRREARRVRDRRDLRPLLRHRRRRADQGEAAASSKAVGVDQFNIYLMTHGQEETLQAYGDDIIPELAGVTA